MPFGGGMRAVLPAERPGARPGYGGAPQASGPPRAPPLVFQAGGRAVTAHADRLQRRARVHGEPGHPARLDRGRPPTDTRPVGLHPTASRRSHRRL